MFYTNDDIQDMIKECNSNPELKEKVVNQISNDRDRAAIISVLKEGWYEEFDRYDSDVCEQFITAYEKAKKESE